MTISSLLALCLFLAAGVILGIALVNLFRARGAAAKDAAPKPGLLANVRSNLRAEEARIRSDCEAAVQAMRAQAAASRAADPGSDPLGSLMALYQKALADLAMAAHALDSSTPGETTQKLREETKTAQELLLQAVVATAALTIKLSAPTPLAS